MKLLLQRTKQAKVTVDGKTVAQSRAGYLAFLCAEKGDRAADLEYLAKKLINLRVFADSEGKMNLDIKQVAGEVLLVSQFTLAANLRKGNRPSFIDAEEPEQAKAQVELFAGQLQGQGVPVKQGVFGAMMDVSLTNDGPVTIWIDSKERLQPRK